MSVFVEVEKWENSVYFLLLYSSLQMFLFDASSVFLVHQVPFIHHID